MELEVQSGNLVSWQGDGIVINLFDGVTTLGGATGAVDQAVLGLISQR